MSEQPRISSALTFASAGVSDPIRPELAVAAIAWLRPTRDELVEARQWLQETYKHFADMDANRAAGADSDREKFEGILSGMRSDDSLEFRLTAIDKVIAMMDFVAPWRFDEQLDMDPPQADR